MDPLVAAVASLDTRRGKSGTPEIQIRRGRRQDCAGRWLLSKWGTARPDVVGRVPWSAPSTEHRALVFRRPFLLPDRTTCAETEVRCSFEQHARWRQCWPRSHLTRWRHPARSV